MRVPDFMYKCIAFVGEEAHRDGLKSYGDVLATGFFIAVPSRVPGKIYSYFVTARHVVEHLVGRESCLFLNLKNGGVALSAIDTPERWFFHPTDATADVAVITVALPPEIDVLHIPVDDLLTVEAMDEYGIGIGDEVFITGLFSPALGARRTQAIIRTGNLAMLPSEQTQTAKGFADVYLIEARSIGGLSGSPIFVRDTIYTDVNLAHRDKPEKTRRVRVGGTSYRPFLLGLVQGHWDIDESRINSPTVVHDSRRGVNMGIAIVVPATKILEIINMPEVKNEREARDNELIQKSLPTEDLLKSEPFTKADFEDALRKASRKTDDK